MWPLRGGSGGPCSGESAPVTSTSSAKSGEVNERTCAKPSAVTAAVAAEPEVAAAGRVEPTSSTAAAICSCAGAGDRDRAIGSIAKLVSDWVAAAAARDDSKSMVAR